MKDKRLLTLFLIILVDLLGFSLILPLLPYYATAYGANDTVVGLLLASYAAAQIIGAPILGRLSDQYGRRPVLLISILGTAIGFLIMGLAQPLGTLISGHPEVVLAILFVSRVLDGLTGGNITVVQAYVTDITTSQNRATGLGLIGAAFGIGFTFGPVMGGFLSRNGDYDLPAFVAAGMALVNFIAVLRFLPESLTPERRLEIAQNPSPQFTFQALQQAFNRPKLGPLLYIRFIFTLAFSLFTVMFSQFAQRLEFTSQSTGYILGYVGILVSLVQGMAMRRLTARFPEYKLIFWASGLMTISLFAWAFTPNLIFLLIVLVPLALASGILTTLTNSVLTKVVMPEEVGGILGISTSLESFSRVVAPILGGILFDNLGRWSAGVLGAGLMALLLPYIWKHLIAHPIPLMPKQVES